MPKTLGIWEWGCPKRGDAQNAVTPEHPKRPGDRFSCRGSGTGTNYEKRVNKTRNSVGNSKGENGPTFLDFLLFLGIFHWDEPTKRVPFTAEPEIITIKW